MENIEEEKEKVIAESDQDIQDINELPVLGFAEDLNNFESYIENINKGFEQDAVEFNAQIKRIRSNFLGED